MAAHNDTLLEGVWGPITATLDWCEVRLTIVYVGDGRADCLQANYLFSPYIAEMANTLSNFYSIGLALFGVLSTKNEFLPTRYSIAYWVRLGCCVFAHYF
jgi:dihydroceramidase